MPLNGLNAHNTANETMKFVKKLQFETNIFSTRRFAGRSIVCPFECRRVAYSIYPTASHTHALTMYLFRVGAATAAQIIASAAGCWPLQLFLLLLLLPISWNSVQFTILCIIFQWIFLRCVFFSLFYLIIFCLSIFSAVDSLLFLAANVFGSVVRARARTVNCVACINAFQ